MTERALTPTEQEDIHERVVDALLALSRVSLGDPGVQLDTDGPRALSALFGRMNELLTSLGAEREQSASFRRELEEKLTMVEQQRAAIRELSTPIIEVWKGVLCLPVVGVMDTARSSEMATSLLKAVVEKGADFTIIDITGIEVMDTRTVDHLVRLAKAVRLVGAECVLTGVAPHIAQTITHMGVEFSDVVTHRSLRHALQSYVAKTSRAV